MKIIIICLVKNLSSFNLTILDNPAQYNVIKNCCRPTFYSGFVSLVSNLYCFPAVCAFDHQLKQLMAKSQEFLDADLPLLESL